VAGGPRSPRSAFPLAAAAGAVLAIGAAAWVLAGAGRHRTLESQGGALARALAEGARTSLEAVEALEARLAHRLQGAAHRVDRETAGDPDPGPLLDEIRRAERLARVFLFRADGTLAAAAPPPPPPRDAGAGDEDPAERAAAAEADDAAAEARALLVSGEPVRVRGLASNPFGTRTRLGVAVLRASGRGAVLVRADADEVQSLRERVGVGTLLARAAAVPGVVGVAAWDGSGRVIASAGSAPPAPGDAPGDVAGTPAGPALLAVAPFPVSGAGTGEGTLAIRLSTAGFDDVAARARLGVLAATAAALSLALGSLALLERARRRAEDADRERLAREERDRRLASLGELGAGLAHEIRNPLNAIDLTVQRFGREVRGATPEDAARLADATAVIRREVRGLDRLVEAFLRFARSPDPRPAPADLAAVVRAEAALAAPEAEARGIRLEVVEEPPVPPVSLDADLFSQALRNLVRNALEASPRGEAVLLVVGSEAGRARVEVVDRGPGVPAGDRDRVFDLFHTTREGGTGLGLPLALRSVRRHGGTIEVRDAPGGGARFVVLLPARERDA
jgi:signal transduction histidine kinase